MTNSLLKNTCMLYILLASNYIFGFISIPYLTRVLGPEVYGKIGLATAVTTYFQMLLDFGFILSSTAKVSLSREDSQYVSSLLSAVTTAKIILSLVCLAILGILFVSSSIFRDEWLLYTLYLSYAIVNSLVPDFLYRGIEKMEVVTLRSVAIKALALVLMTLVIRRADQYVFVPLFYLLGAICALIAVAMHLKKRTEYRLVRIERKQVFLELKESFDFFVSRIASTVYTSLSIIVLGAIYPGSPQLGYYTAADRAIAAGRSLSSPVSDSLYPYMVKRKNYRLLVLVALLGTAILTVASVVCAFFSTEICVLLFGAEYAETGPILRTLLPLIPISLLSYLFGFPALVPLGFSRWANISVVIGACFQALALFVLIFTASLNITTLCIIMVIAELVVLALRLAAFTIGWRKQTDV